MDHNKMNSAPIYQVDAFTNHLFGGNPAAVCLLEHWPEDAIMQKIAQENNLAETAFLVRNGPGFDIRWFTPLLEVDLCGHATLAAAHVLFHIRSFEQQEILLNSKSGPLTVSKQETGITLDFPADPPEACDPVPGLLETLGLTQGQTFMGKTDLMVVVENEDTVLSVAPDYRELIKLKVRGVIVTAPGHQTDFVSRFFAPASGIDEDPVTGSAHCTLTPYWSAVLGKNVLSARQLSARGGDLHCELVDDRVRLTGTSVTYLTGLVNY